MRIVIAYTSKPCDGLLYYSYEHCCYLNSIGIDSKVVILPHPKAKIKEYSEALKNKYKYYKNVEFNDYDIKSGDITMIMGRSLLTLAHEHVIKGYDFNQTFIAKLLFTNKLICVYAENHPIKFPNAIEFFKPKFVYNLCDYDVYPKGIGEHFKKIINFSIYKDFKTNIKFKYLFNGVNKKYYSAFLNSIKTIKTKKLKLEDYSVDEVDYFDGEKLKKISLSTIDNFNSHGILVLRDPLNRYGEKFKKDQYNNVTIPVKNILGMFDTYVYNKEVFDPAPRLMMECKYFKKKFIFLRDPRIIDGGSAYLKREPYCMTSDKNIKNNKVLLKAIRITDKTKI